MMIPILPLFGGYSHNVTICPMHIVTVLLLNNYRIETRLGVLPT